MSDFTIISNSSSLKDLQQQRKNLCGYIRWAKKALDKHIKTSKPIIVRTKDTGAYFLDFLELEKDLRNANLELYAIIRIIQQKRRNNEKEKI